MVERREVKKKISKLRADKRDLVDFGGLGKYEDLEKRHLLESMKFDVYSEKENFIIHKASDRNIFVKEMKGVDNFRVAIFFKNRLDGLGLDAFKQFMNAEMGKIPAFESFLDLKGGDTHFMMDYHVASDLRWVSFRSVFDFTSYYLRMSDNDLDFSWLVEDNWKPYEDSSSVFEKSTLPMGGVFVDALEFLIRGNKSSKEEVNKTVEWVSFLSNSLAGNVGFVAGKRFVDEGRHLGRGVCGMSFIDVLSVFVADRNFGNWGQRNQFLINVLEQVELNDLKEMISSADRLGRTFLYNNFTTRSFVSLYPTNGVDKNLAIGGLDEIFSIIVDRVGLSEFELESEDRPLTEIPIKIVSESLRFGEFLARVDNAPKGYWNYFKKEMKKMFDIVNGSKREFSFDLKYKWVSHDLVGDDLVRVETDTRLNVLDLNDSHNFLKHDILKDIEGFSIAKQKKLDGFFSEEFSSSLEEIEVEKPKIGKMRF